MYSLNELFGKLTTWLASQPKLIPSQPPLTIDKDGWLSGDGVTVIKAHPSWHGHWLTGSMPGGTVVHDSDTKPGTALAMAKRRSRQFGLDANDRMASWHASVETSGAIVQMVSLRVIAWHAGSDTASQIPGLGWANYRTNGIELVGNNETYPEAQVWAYARLLRAIVQWAGIKREHAMVAHAVIDPKRRRDGAKFVEMYGAGVLEYVYR